MTNKKHQIVIYRLARFNFVFETEAYFSKREQCREFFKNYTDKFCSGVNSPIFSYCIF